MQKAYLQYSCQLHPYYC